MDRPAVVRTALARLEQRQWPVLGDVLADEAEQLRAHHPGGLRCGAQRPGELLGCARYEVRGLRAASGAGRIRGGQRRPWTCPERHGHNRHVTVAEAAAEHSSGDSSRVGYRRDCLRGAGDRARRRAPLRGRHGVPVAALTFVLNLRRLRTRTVPSPDTQNFRIRADGSPAGKAGRGASRVRTVVPARSGGLRAALPPCAWTGASLRVHDPTMVAARQLVPASNCRRSAHRYLTSREAV